MPKRCATSVMGASPTWANQPTTASRRRSRSLVSRPGTPRPDPAGSPVGPALACSADTGTGAVIGFAPSSSAMAPNQARSSERNSAGSRISA